MTQFTDIGCAFKRNRPKEFRRFFRDDIKFERKTNYILEVSKGHRERFVFIMENASQFHLVVDTLIATVTFAAGITMPGGFIGQEGPQPGSAVLTRNAAFRVFVITDTIAMVQSCCAAFIYLFMPLLIREQNLGGFTFLLALLAFCLTILAMGATVLAFVAGTYAVLMHSSDLAIATSVIGLCFFIPGLFISIGCSSYLDEIWGMCMFWINKKRRLFLKYLEEKALVFPFPCACVRASAAAASIER
ncbi:hypothetical protein CFP56_016232 [Quercus suber]|uniref:PGG domain-containing protein n=1 Tax=Quercus suber TaxID=58331 RepID=A0AAW0KNR6_QUESU